MSKKKKVILPYLRYFLLLFVFSFEIVTIVTLCGCGGGGGSSTTNTNNGGSNNGGSNNTFTPVPSDTKAKITSENAVHLLTNAYTSTIGALWPTKKYSETGAVALNAYLSLAQSLEETIRENANLTQSPGDTVSASTTIRGYCPDSPGYAEVNIKKADNYTASAKFYNYCLFGNTISGSVEVEGTAFYDSGRILSATYTLNNLIIHSSSSDYSMTGTIICFYPGIYPSGAYYETQQVEFNCVLKDVRKQYEYRDVFLRLVPYEDNFKIYIGDETSNVSGPFFDPQYGYVEISTPSPFTIDYNSIYPASGELVIKGDNNTSAKLILTQGGKNFSIEADTSGDGVYDWISENAAFTEDSPKIILTTPSASSKNTPVNSIIRISFNKEMDESKINNSTLKINGGAISGNIEYIGNTVFFKPSVNLDGGKTYTVSLSSGITDKEGNSLPSYRWSFTTNPVSKAYSFSFPVSDVEYNPSYNSLYVTSKEEKKLYHISLDSGSIIKEYSFMHMPEKITTKPGRKKMYVSLLVKEHNDYWWKEDQEGYIAEFDMEDDTKLKEFRIDLDPYEMVVTSDGYLYTTSGSGQNSYFDGYDINTGQRVGRVGFYQKNFMNYHPSENFIYTYDHGIPSSIKIIDIENGLIDSIFEQENFFPADRSHWRYPFYLYDDPLGRYVITNWGEILNKSEYTAQGRKMNSLDLSNPQRFAYSEVYAVADDPLHGYIFTVEEYVINYYDKRTFAWAGSIPIVRSETNYLFFNQDYNQIYYIKTDGVDTEIDTIPNPASRINDSPIVICSVDKTSGTTIDSFRFDASASSDSYPGEPIYYRWDWDNDGSYDTDYLTSGVTYHSFSKTGKNEVTLAVIDTMGLESTYPISIDITGDELPDFKIGKVVDLIADPNPEIMYSLDNSNSALYFINTLSEQIVKKVELPYPNPIALSYSQNDKLIYIVFEGSNAILKYNVATGNISELTLTNNHKVVDIEVSDNLRRIYALSTLDTQYYLLIINMDSEEILSSTAVDGQTIHLDESRQKLFMADKLDYRDSICRYSIVNDMLLLEQSIDSYIGKFDISLSPDGLHVLAPSTRSNVNALINDYDATGLTNLLGGWSVGTHPAYGIISPDGNTMYGIDCSMVDSYYIHVMDAKNYVELKKFGFPGKSDDPYSHNYGVLALNSDGTVLVGFRTKLWPYQEENTYKIYFFDTEEE